MYSHNGVDSEANWDVAPTVSQDGEPWQSGNPSAPAPGTILSWWKEILNRLRWLKNRTGFLLGDNLWKGSNTFQPDGPGKSVIFGNQLDETKIVSPLNLWGNVNAQNGADVHLRSGSNFVAEDGAVVAIETPFIRFGDNAPRNDRVKPVPTGSTVHVDITADVWELGTTGTDVVIKIDAPPDTSKSWLLTISRNDPGDVSGHLITIKDDAGGVTLALMSAADYHGTGTGSNAVTNGEAWAEFRWNLAGSTWRLVRWGGATLKS